MSIKPPVQISKKPQFLPGVHLAVALFEKEPSKPVDVTRRYADYLLVLLFHRPAGLIEVEEGCLVLSLRLRPLESVCRL